jgi:putative endonuclease
MAFNFGDLGEKFAAQYLKSNNYLVIDSHFHSRFGEIDLICFDKTAKQLVFIEVKTRNSQRFGTGLDAFTVYKRQKILRTIFCYFQKNKFISWRLDLISIKMNKQAKPEKITHLKSV